MTVVALQLRWNMAGVYHLLRMPFGELDGVIEKQIAIDRNIGIQRLQHLDLIIQFEQRVFERVAFLSQHLRPFVDMIGAENPPGIFFINQQRDAVMAQQQAVDSEMAAQAVIKRHAGNLFQSEMAEAIAGAK